MEPFKNKLNPAVVGEIADWLEAARPGWDGSGFRTAASRGLEELELKDRVRHIAGALREHLSADYPSALAHIVDALPPPLGSDDSLVDEFHLWPLCTFVELYGVPHFDVSVPAMRELTRRFSAEFAVRPYIRAYPQAMFDVLARWALDDDVHVRRLASEGSRPRLPWGGQLRALIADPSPMLPILESLRDDPSEYVRRSVANHLNDIAKDHPDVVIDVARRWWDDRSKTRQKLVKHALRTLVKQGHPGALSVLGYGPAQVELTELSLSTRQPTLGEPLFIDVELRSSGPSVQRLLIDYAVHHQKANGTTIPKVFKWTTRELAAGASLRIRKKHALKPVTTRRYHAGLHRVEVLVNGASLGTVDFELSLP